jgi:hypothetical protein
MAIRLRRVNGMLVALCAAKSVEKADDLYLDDEQHHALATKFSIDFTSEGWGDIPFDEEEKKAIDAEETDNPNRRIWDAIQNRPPLFYVGDKVELSIPASTPIITTVTTIDVFRGKYYYTFADVGAEWPEPMLRAVNDGS